MSKKLFTKYTLFLTVAGLALNFLLVWMTGVFGIPLYLDSVGTVIVASLGGVLPGIAVGFLSNCLTSLLSVSPDPMTLYYGFLNVLIAAVTAVYSQKGLLKKWYGRVLTVFSLSAIGGALGSVVTWILYGFSFGQGISAPLAGFYFNNFRFGEFNAQFAADLSIDLIDKTITVAVLCIVLYLLPASFMDKLPLGSIYCTKHKHKTPAELYNKGQELLREENLFRKRSIRTNITAIILISTTILSVIAVSISVTTYKSKLTEQYSAICRDTVDMMLTQLNGDKLRVFLSDGEDANEYAECEQSLSYILNNSDKIKYMYVYSIQPDGCHVIFDIDTPELEGEDAGTVIPFDETFPFINDLLDGRDIPPVITDDTYGWLLTVYKPVRDSYGAVVAYAAADIDMESIKSNTYTFCINIASLLFGIMIIITAFSLWYCEKRLLEPINVLVKQARSFDYRGDGNGERVRESLSVKTGDELEEVFKSMCRTEDAITEHVAELGNKNREISQMQRNIIYTLANMVENRDGNTGGHIKRTANYVRLIGEKLRDAGIYTDIVNDDYIKLLYTAAPLHDIGKIKIPDAVLCKPGKLTAEEFELMKTHSSAGRDILATSLSGIEDSAWLTMAIDMAAYHHEKWNGSGYPEGLSGDAIPLCARIMAVSDVFDALVSERSYKKAFPFDEAMQIIKESSGSHFDPKIVEVFAAASVEIREIMLSCSE